MSIIISYNNCAFAQCIEGQFSQKGSDCSVYQWCVHGKELDQQCPSGLYWNQEVNVCDWPRNVNCPYEGATTAGRFLLKYLIGTQRLDKRCFCIDSSVASALTISTSSMDQASLALPNVTPSLTQCVEGQFSQRGPDCNVYQWCIHGKELDQQCPSGLYWNQEVNACDWPRNVNCPFNGATTGCY